MPIYAYKCGTCDKQFEVHARMSDPAPTRGEDCTSTQCTLQKIMSPVSISIASGGAKGPRERAPESVAPAKPAHACGFGCKH